MNQPAASNGCIVTLNGGSSSIKFAVYADVSAAPLLSGEVERIGQPTASLHARRGNDELPKEMAGAQDHGSAGRWLLKWIEEQLAGRPIAAVGHRLVHGGLRAPDHGPIDDALLAELKRSEPLDTAHLPRELALIEAVSEALPDLPQFACFDTAFHRGMPAVAQRLPIPRQYSDAGLRRFGFHGLSYTYLMSALQDASPQEGQGRVILAHLGSGASMAAVRGGKPIETTMAFTALAGLVMGTRCGDLDPGLLLYLMRTERMDAAALDDLLSRQSGMLGVSQTSADVRDLTERSKNDPRAAEAIELFCYRARQWVGALAATMGALDTLVFSGGIGEHASAVRAQIVAELAFLGVQLDGPRNDANEAIISAPSSRVVVRVIPTDEQVVIARIVQRLMRG